MSGVLHVDEGLHRGSGPRLRYDDSNTANKVFLMKSRGWTRAAIKRFLGEPDFHLSGVQRWRETPGIPMHASGFRSDRPECCYRMERVLRAEGSPEYMAWKARKQQSLRHGPPKTARERRAILADNIDVFMAGGLLQMTGHGAPAWVRNALRRMSRRDQRVLNLLLVRGWTQAAVGRRVGVCQQTISRIRSRFLLLMKQNAKR